MIAPTENRATIAAQQENRTLDQFITDTWDRRAVEHPHMKAPEASKAWPFKRDTNVTPIRKKRNG